MKARDNVADPPPGAEFVTVKARSPAVAPAAIVTLAVTCVPLESTDAELIVMPEPKSAELTPIRNPEPVTVTDRVCPRTPEFGDTLVSTGKGF